MKPQQRHPKHISSCTGPSRSWAASCTPTRPTQWPLPRRGATCPPFGTTHADYFYGPVPCTRELTPGEIDEDYEKNTGKVIIETFQNRGIDPVHVPGVLCASHGPFTWGKDAAQAVYHAVVLEEVARMAILTLTIDPDAQPAPQHVLDKHFMRKTRTQRLLRPEIRRFNRMKFYIDTANVDEIRSANDMGIIAGVTTNPA